MGLVKRTDVRCLAGRVGGGHFGRDFAFGDELDLHRNMRIAHLKLALHYLLSHDIDGAAIGKPGDEFDRFLYLGSGGDHDLLLHLLGDDFLDDLWRRWGDAGGQCCTGTGHCRQT